MRALITGGAGFIGSHTADALLRANCQVRVLDSLEAPVHPARRKPDYLDPEIEFIRGDVRKEADLLPAMAGCDWIIHLAAFQDYLPVFSRYFDVNVTSTALIYELIVREKLPVRKVLVASSQATLGEGLYLDAAGRRLLPDIRPDAQLRAGRWDIEASPGYAGPLQWQPTDETVANPQNQYGISKLTQENIALHLGKRYAIPSVAMRYSIVQGPRQSVHNAYSGACRVFCLAGSLGRDMPIFEDGLQIRDFVNIHDVVDANLLCLQDERADDQMFHVGGDHPVTVIDFARLVAEHYGRPDYTPQPSGKYRFGDTRHICSKVDKLKALGWAPRRTMHDSVAAYKQWLVGIGALDDILRTAEAQMQAEGILRAVDS